MTLKEILHLAAVLAEKENVHLDRESIKEVLKSSLSAIHIEVKAPKTVWVSASDKTADDNPIEFPSTNDSECVSVEDVYLDGVKLEKHHLDKLLEINNDSEATT